MDLKKKSLNHISYSLNFTPKSWNKMKRLLFLDIFEIMDYVCFGEFFPLKVIPSYILNVISICTNVHQAIMNFISNETEHSKDINYWGCFLWEKICIHHCGHVFIAEVFTMVQLTCCTIHRFLDCWCALNVPSVLDPSTLLHVWNESWRSPDIWKPVKLL